MIHVILWVVLIAFSVTLFVISDTVNGEDWLAVASAVIIGIVIVWGAFGVYTMSQVQSDKTASVMTSTNNLTNAVAPVK